MAYILKITNRAFLITAFKNTVKILFQRLSQVIFYLTYNGSVCARSSDQKELEWETIVIRTHYYLMLVSEVRKPYSLAE